jgi:hypothetical protein
MKTRDIDIRSGLHSILHKEHINDPSTLILDELGLCQGESRIDVAVVNGSLNGFEIKSESDTLERLPKQCEIYNKIFDTVTIVTAARFIDNIKDIVPKWWGITRAERDIDGIVYFFNVRRAKSNKKIDPYSLVQLLWREETLELLKEKDLHRGILSKPRDVLWKVLSENVPLTELQESVRQKLKLRKNWRAH